VHLFSLSVSEALDVFFDPVLQTLSEIVYFVAQEKYDEEVVKRLLTIKLVSRSQFKSYFALDRFGTVKFTIPQDPEREGVNLSGYEFFVKRSYDGYVRLSLPFISPNDGSMSLAAYTSYDDKTFVGLIDFGRVESMSGNLPCCRKPPDHHRQERHGAREHPIRDGGGKKKFP
jgi:hypothetical protein